MKAKKICSNSMPTLDDLAPASQRPWVWELHENPGFFVTLAQVTWPGNFLLYKSSDILMEFLINFGPKDARNQLGTMKISWVRSFQ